MNIAIDARTILNPEKGDDIGIGHYTYQLLRHLFDSDIKNRYTVFFDYRVRQKDVGKFSRPNVRVRYYPFSDYKRYLPVAYNEILGQASLTREHFDVLHSTSPLSRTPLLYRGKCVTTFHNMGVFRYPECYAALERSKDQALWRYMAKKSDAIVAVSESLRDDLVSLLGVDDAKIHIIRGGLDKRFFLNPEISLDQVKQKFGICKPYILFLGTLSPINNVTRLLESFARFKRRWHLAEKTPFSYQLIIAGKRGWMGEEYVKVASNLEIQKEIIFTGYISGEEASALFRGCEFFIMPSLYEGFGTTVLEAMAAGAPVIASNLSSLPEVAGDAALFVNPTDIAAIADSLWMLAHDENARNELRIKGRSHAEKFGWDKAAQETLQLYINMTS